MSKSTHDVIAAFAVGATFGALDAAGRLFVLAHAGPTAAALLVVYGCLGFGLLSALAALCLAPLSRLLKITQPSNPGFGVGVGTFAAVQFVWALVSLRQPELAWLVLPCVLLGGLVGLLAHKIAAGVALPSTPAFWMAVNAIVVAIGIAVVVAKPSFRSSQDRAIGTERPPNVVLISIDTLRRDRLGSYGHRNAQTPHLDALAKAGALFETVMSPAPITAPSHITMLSGLYPAHHGTVRNGASLADDSITVADWLSPAGYKTAAFVSGWPLTDEACGLAGEFEHFDDDLSGWPALPSLTLRSPIIRLPILAWLFLTRRDIISLERPAAATTSRALVWLSRQRDTPFFLFVHYFEPHQPYTPPAELEQIHDPTYTGEVHALDREDQASLRRVLANARDVEHVKALYDAEISSADREVGRLLAALTASGNPTLIVFTSDHGESLTEHSSFFDHGDFLYQPSVHVPLIIRFPNGEYAGTRIPALVRLADIAPTILDVVGLPREQGLDGRSLLPVLNGSEVPNERKAFGAVEGTPGGEISRCYARDGRYKLIWSFDHRRRFSDAPAYEELYDLEADPGELSNLASYPSIGAELRDHLRTYVRELPRTVPRLSADVREKLRALGYE